MVLEAVQKLLSLKLEHCGGKRLEQKSQTEVSTGGEFLVKWEWWERKRKFPDPQTDNRYSNKIY